MTDWSDSKIRSLTARFCACDLAAEAFDHPAHWAAALGLLADHAPERVAAEMPDMIRSFNCHHGGRNTDSEGYHETITLASIAAAAEALRVAGGDLEIAHKAILSSALGQTTWLGRHWRRETLFSAQARRGWVAPDLLALPFGIYHPVAKAA